MICSGCGEEKPTREFPRNRSTQSGWHVECKKCHNGRKRDLINRRYGGTTRHYHLRQRYGLGEADVDRIIERQGGLCAICNDAPATQVDHDHRTGKVRGALCLECNAGLGAFADDERLLFAAVDYLHPVSVEEWVE